MVRSRYLQRWLFRCLCVGIILCAGFLLVPQFGGTDMETESLIEDLKRNIKQIENRKSNQEHSDKTEVHATSNTDQNDGDAAPNDKIPPVGDDRTTTKDQGPLKGMDDSGESEIRALAAPRDLRQPQGVQNKSGELGRPVIIEREKLSPRERELYDRGWKNNGFNQYASDMISPHRSLPDVRHPECRNMRYQQPLPGACVIIIFHNEALSVLLRTVHSVLDRSDPSLVKQIILVDDFSSFDHLKQPLDDFVAEQPKVSLIRAVKRSGLIRARLMGFEKCTAEVAIFLDSHCEATEGWLEPLLDRIARNWTNVVVPVIDVIDKETFEYQRHEWTGTSTSVFVGGFDWLLLFNWHPLPDREFKRVGYKLHLPIRTPTMAGGLFAINSQYFRKLGTYDPGMEIWGGENLELSFKTWMCGGTLETIPCSHVGHVFRKFSPYTWVGENVLRKNTVRLAEVWLDDFKTYFYRRINYQMPDYGDVSERKELRRSLNCKSFKWYLTNVFPELFIPSEALASGEIRNPSKNMCADASVESNKRDNNVAGYPCHSSGGNQYWMLTKGDEIRRDETCWDYTGGAKIAIFECHRQHGNQNFRYRKDDTIYSAQHDKCATLSWDGKSIEMEACTGGPRQIWKWNRNPPNGPTRD